MDGGRVLPGGEMYRSLDFLSFRHINLNGWAARQSGKLIPFSNVRGYFYETHQNIHDAYQFDNHISNRMSKCYYKGVANGRDLRTGH